jgi:L-threonylcarbamoyladenylate synthase
MTELPRPALLRANDPDALDEAAAAMQAGGIVGLPTETVYGIGVLPRPAALAAVIAAKGRAEDKGIALLIDGLDQVEGLVAVSEPARRLADRFWPGALTLVLPLIHPDLVPDLLSGGQGMLGLRVPDHAVPRTLARLLGPIAVTSANRAGEPAAASAQELLGSLGAALALVLDDGPVRGGVASTVVRLDTDGGCEVVREGALGRDRIMSVVGGA